MAQGERAERAGHAGRDYWSRRLPGGCTPWGAVGKWITHRRERAAAQRELVRIRKEAPEEPAKEG